VAAGVFADVEDACARVSLRPEVMEPDAGRGAAYEERYALYRELYPATVGLAHRL
jgi:xylulokinase